MTKIVVYSDPLPFDEESIHAIRSAAPTATVVTPTKEQLEQELAEAEIFFGFSPPDVFLGANQLRWIQATAAGMERILTPDLIQRGLTICNASGVHGPQVAEMAWALTLAVARRIDTFVRNQQRHHWEWTTNMDMEGSTAGIIGLGGIGRRYARAAAAFGMRVLAVDLHRPPKPDEVEALWPIDRLDEMLEQADVLMIACPYTSKTHHLIDRDRLARMKPSAILVNIARGEIVEEESLAQALRERRLSGAGIDVTETEPLPEDSPLWDVPNLIITPHCAGHAPNRARRLTEFFCENLRRYLTGEPLTNVVDQQKGYPVPG